MQKNNDIEKISEMLEPVFRKNKAVKAVLFGSQSRGTQTRKSDLDLMIVIKTKKRFFDRFEQFDVINDLISDRYVDMLIYTPEEVLAISHRPLIKRILAEGKTIYES
jgi:predicted nucleotidyltransferase